MWLIIISEAWKITGIWSRYLGDPFSQPTVVHGRGSKEECNIPARLFRACKLLTLGNKIKETRPSRRGTSVRRVAASRTVHTFTSIAHTYAAGGRFINSLPCRFQRRARRNETRRRSRRGERRGGPIGGVSDYLLPNCRLYISMNYSVRLAGASTTIAFFVRNRHKVHRVNWIALC